MTVDRAGPPMPGNGPHPDIESLIRAMHAELGRVAFRSLGNRADAEDAIQAACVNILRCWPKVADLQTAAQQRAYLITTVTNEALQIHRQPHRRRERSWIEGIDLPLEPHFPGGHGQTARDHLRRVWQAMSELPNGIKEVVTLFAAGYEYREIAEMLDIQISTVRSHISSARKRLPRAQGDVGEEGRA